MIKMWKLLFLIYTSLVTICTCKPCTNVESLDISGGVLHDNGSVVYDGFEYTSSTWYEVEEDERVIRYGCPCINRVCVYKCCGLGEAFFNTTCRETDLAEVNPFSPSVYKGKELSNLLAHEHFFYMYRRPCNDRYLVDTASGVEELYIQEVSSYYKGYKNIYFILERSVQNW